MAVPALKVGFIGSGKMATALAKGFVQGNAIASSKQIFASCPVADSYLLDGFKNLGCQTLHDNKELVDSTDIVILAVKPNIVPFVLSETKTLFGENKTLVSIAAGIKIAQLQNNLMDKSKVIRLMPNTPCLVREGASVFSMGNAATLEDRDNVQKLFEAVGECHQVPEALIDAVTAMSGSGPAYMYMIIEALADGGVKQGLPRDLAYRLAAQTMVGAGKMVLDTNAHPAVLKDEVCSPGGTTITALDMLEKSGLRTGLMQAVEAATKRCKQLSGD